MSLLRVSTWRAEPYRPLFLIGIAMAWLGVGHWLLLAVGAFDEYRSIFHAMAQIQAFVTCFALGFLFTFVPRRTGTPPPSWLELLLAMAVPPLIVAAAWRGRFAAATALWLGVCVLALVFIGRRFRGPKVGALPAAFLFVPTAFVIGIAGAFLTGIGAARMPDDTRLHDLGRGMVLQGVVTALVLGIGQTLFPMILRGEPPSGDRFRAVQVASAVALVASFFVEQLVDVRAGLLLRAAASGTLVWGARLYRPPVLPGLHRWLIWASGWLLVGGYALTALLPEWRRATLHVTFIGGFGLMLLSVSLHVALMHSGRGEKLTGSSPRMRGLAALLALALGCRALVDLDPLRFHLWLGSAAAAFLAATLVWTSLVLGRATQISKASPVPS